MPTLLAICTTCSRHTVLQITSCISTLQSLLKHCPLSCLSSHQLICTFDQRDNVVCNLAACGLGRVGKTCPLVDRLAGCVLVFTKSLSVKVLSHCRHTSFILFLYFCGVFFRRDFTLLIPGLPPPQNAKVGPK